MFKKVLCFTKGMIRGIKFNDVIIKEHRMVINDLVTADYAFSQAAKKGPDSGLSHENQDTLQKRLR